MPNDVFSSWSEGSRIVTAVGREDYLAARITAERNARGWSQERLAKEMKAIGCHMPQPSISKIENPKSGGRRDITVDEAIAFSKLFGIPLGELLLPTETLRHLSVIRDLVAGEEAALRFRLSRDYFEALAEGVARASLEDPEILKTIRRELRTAKRDAQEMGAREMSTESAEDRRAFLEQVMEARDRHETQTPQEGQS